MTGDRLYTTHTNDDFGDGLVFSRLNYSRCVILVEYFTDTTTGDLRYWEFNQQWLPQASLGIWIPEPLKKNANHPFTTGAFLSITDLHTHSIFYECLWMLLCAPVCHRFELWGSVSSALSISKLAMENSCAQISFNTKISHKHVMWLTWTHHTTILTEAI